MDTTTAPLIAQSAAGRPAKASRTLRRLTSTAVAVAVGAGTALGAAVPASAATTAPAAHGTRAAAAAAPTTAQLEAQFLTLLNRHRTDAKLKPVTVSSDLVSIARSWSSTMAGSSNLAHDPDLANLVTNWQVVGENVGDGTDVRTLDDAFWASPGHRENELYPTFTDVGIGVVVKAGTVWVTFDFRQELHPSAPAAAPADPGAAAKAAAAKAAKKAAAGRAAKAKAAKLLAAKKAAAAKRAAARKAAAKHAGRRRHGHLSVSTDPAATARAAAVAQQV